MTDIAEKLSEVRQSKSHRQRRTAEFTESSHYNYKQVARIIQYLCHELKTAHPELKLPSAWMIQCLVFNVFQKQSVAGNVNSTRQSIIITVLQAMRISTNVGLDRHCIFTQLDGITPLFPNSEGFDEWDAFRFSQTLLYYLEKKLS